MDSQTSTAFVDELTEIQKEAGLKDALVTALTGRVPFYHGTAKSLARKILQEGIRPQASKGVSSTFPGLVEAEKGLAFTTRMPDRAAFYASQAAGIQRLEKLKKLIKSKNLPGVKKWQEIKASEIGPMATKIELDVARMLGGLPGGKAVVRGSIPREALKKLEGTIPEMAHSGAQLRRGLLGATGLSEPVVSTIEKATVLPYANTLSIKGGVPTKFLRGSKDYQQVTLPELRAHARSVRKNPKEFAKDVARTLTGQSHRPSTILNQAALENTALAPL